VLGLQSGAREAGRQAVCLRSMEKAALIMASTTPTGEVRDRSTYATKNWGVRAPGSHARWPKVADVVIEAEKAAVSQPL
jgi:hypothetical protein